jgi:hypothetical protein
MGRTRKTKDSTSSSAGPHERTHCRRSAAGARTPWERFKALAGTLQQEHANDTGCYIGINEERTEPSVLFRVERRRCASMNAVAVTASPDVQGDTHLVFRVQTVTVVDGSVSNTPAEVLPVFYDARGQRFTIETVPPVEEHQMAEFFLTRVQGLLDDLASRSMTADPIGEVWIRRHARGEITLMVTGTSPGLFEIDAYVQNERQCPHPATSLETAKLAADTLVREQLQHVCGSTCGEWELLMSGSWTHTEGGA